MLNQGILKPGNKLYMSLALSDEDIQKTINILINQLDNKWNK